MARPAASLVPNLRNATTAPSTFISLDWLDKYSRFVRERLSADDYAEAEDLFSLLLRQDFRRQLPRPIPGNARRVR
jgi:hypothetical protein